MDEAFSAAYLPDPTPGGAPQPAAAVDSTVPRGAGLTMFAGTMLALVGVLNLIYGLAAVSGSDALPKQGDYIVSDLKALGWVMVMIGSLQIAAGLGVWAGRRWARWVGVATASLNMVVQLFWLPAQPLVALAMYGLDILVLYALLAYGPARQD